MRRGIQVFGWALIWGGILIFGYLGWELAVTNLINSRVQAQASGELDSYFEAERQDLPQVIVSTPEDAPDEVVAFHPEVVPPEGTGFAHISVPRVGLEAVVFQGVSTDVLKLGPGHIPDTPLPGQPGNAVISGHRTTHGAPFFDFDQLRTGDRIEVETAIGPHVYEVRDSFVVQPTDVWVTDDRPGGWLTLTTCNPKFSARERLVVVAELVAGPNLAYIDALAGQLEGVS